MKPQVLAITGISGYFGKVLMPLLEEDDAVGKVIGLDRVRPGGAQSWKKLEFHQIDIRDPMLNDLVQDCDAIVHLVFVLMRLPGAEEIDVSNIQTRNIWYTGCDHIKPMEKQF